MNHALLAVVLYHTLWKLLHNYLDPIDDIFTSKNDFVEVGLAIKSLWLVWLVSFNSIPFKGRLHIEKWTGRIKLGILLSIVTYLNFLDDHRSLMIGPAITSWRTPFGFSEATNRHMLWSEQFCCSVTVDRAEDEGLLCLRIRPRKFYRLQRLVWKLIICFNAKVQIHFTWFCVIRVSNITREATHELIKHIN